MLCFILLCAFFPIWIRILNQRILELQAQIEDMQESQEKSVSAQSEGNSEIRKKLSENLQRAQNAELAESRMKSKVEEMEMKLKEEVEEKVKLEEQLKKKEEDMQTMEEKYMKYLEKAKSVSVWLDVMIFWYFF